MNLSLTAAAAAAAAAVAHQIVVKVNFSPYQFLLKTFSVRPKAFKGWSVLKENICVKKINWLTQQSSPKS